jgi:hypothetical protein
MKTALPSRDLGIVLWLGVIALYLFFVGPYVLDQTYWFDRDRDNALLNLNNFSYWAGSIEHGFGLPRWYPYGGGSPVGLSAVVWKALLPHRLFGYLLVLITDLDYVTVFKASLVFGICFSSLGWFLFLKRYFGNSIIGVFGTIPFVFGGFGTTVFHQEYILAHLLWVPWLLLFALNWQKNIQLLVLAAAIFGIAITNDYPQYLVYAVAAAGLLLFIVSPSFRVLLRSALNDSKQRSTILTAVIIFTLAASPLGYLLWEKENYVSPVRGTQGVSYETLSEYEEGLRHAGTTNISYLKQHFAPKRDVPDDVFGMFVGRVVLILALLAILFRRRSVLFPLLLTGVFAWMVAGVNGYLPQLFFLARVPFVDHFRQWYHFFPYLNMGLIFLGAMGFKTLYCWKAEGKIESKLRIALVVILAVSSLYEHCRYFQLYESRYLNDARGKFVHPERLDHASFLRMINTDWTIWLANHQQDRNWRVPDGTGLVHLSEKNLATILVRCTSVFSAGASYAMPNDILANKECKRELSEWNRENESPLADQAEAMSIVVNPVGFSVNVATPQTYFELPINSRLNWAANSVNSEEISIAGTRPALKISMDRPGVRTLTVELRSTFYEYSLLLQLAALVYAIRRAFFGRAHSRR